VIDIVTMKKRITEISIEKINKNEERENRGEEKREKEKNERKFPLFHLLIKKAYHQIPEMLII